MPPRSVRPLGLNRDGIRGRVNRYVVNHPRPAFHEVVDTAKTYPTGRFAGDFEVVASYVDRQQAERHCRQLNDDERAATKLIRQLRRSIAANDRGAA